jgi:hypothetical protein
MDFVFPITITKSRVVYCKELTNGDILSIQKYIETGDKQSICNCFEQLISNLVQTDHILNCVDKLLILLELRRNCISKSIELSVNNKTTVISLKDVCNIIINNYQDKNFKIEHNYNGSNITITCNTPLLLSYYNSLYTSINKVQLDNHEILLNTNLPFVEQILDNIPLKVIRTIHRNHRKFRQNQVELFKVVGDMTIPYYFNYKNVEIYNLIVSCYKSTTESLYRTQYLCVSKLNIQPSEFNQLTPGETKILLSSFTAEIEKQNVKSGGLPGVMV